MSKTLSSLAIGSEVYIKVNGDRISFIVVQQGKPLHSMYDPSTNGTWLMSKNLHTKRMYKDGKTNNYAVSDIHNWLNNTYYNYIDGAIRPFIKQVKIPYLFTENEDKDYFGNDASIALKTGSEGLSTRVFLPSAREINAEHWRWQVYGDGYPLAYFTNANDSKRIATYNGNPSEWWTRTGHNESNEEWYASNWNTTTYKYSVYVEENGYALHSNLVDKSYGIRPMMILDPNLTVSDSNDVQPNYMPGTPPSISYPNSLLGGKTAYVSWGESTDNDNNISGYTLQVSYDAGTTWAIAASGSYKSVNVNIAFGRDSAIFRVCSFDAYGAQSDWRTGPQVHIINNHAPTAPLNIVCPTSPLVGRSFVISWSKSSDVDGNLLGYKLERSFNSGATWSLVYTGENTYFEDIIPYGSEYEYSRKVRYRVKAYDPYDESGYVMTADRNINRNKAPIVSFSNISAGGSVDGSGDLRFGSVSSDISFDFTITEPDNEGSRITAYVAFDSKKIIKPTFALCNGEEQNITLGKNYHCSIDDIVPFDYIINGNHELSIYVQDSTTGDYYVTTVYFTKLVSQCSVTLGTPIPSTSRVQICALKWVSYIPEGANIQVEVTNNPFDSNPTWEMYYDHLNTHNDDHVVTAPGKNRTFLNTTVHNGHGFNFRVTCTRGEAEEGGFLTAIQGGFKADV